MWREHENDIRVTSCCRACNNSIAPPFDANSKTRPAMTTRSKMCHSVPPEVRIPLEGSNLFKNCFLPSSWAGFASNPAVKPWNEDFYTIPFGPFPRHPPPTYGALNLFRLLWSQTCIRHFSFSRWGPRMRIANSKPAPDTQSATRSFTATASSKTCGIRVL